MQEVTGAVIATALVLAAVFVPVAFFPARPAGSISSSR
jgi:multidrug efflux pump subunit AcrB